MSSNNPISPAFVWTFALVLAGCGADQAKVEQKQAEVAEKLDQTKAPSTRRSRPASKSSPRPRRGSTIGPMKRRTPPNARSWIA
ncbi:MAG: hypothetical protein HC927_08625 [Deltaproteobacteria bacterium]|nr:hypothetical protein [Deltaproteobacteria bacterium]